VITNAGALTPVSSGVAKMNTGQNLGATPAEAEALASVFFEQMESKAKKRAGRGRFTA